MYIDDIDIIINQGKLKINFVVDDGIDVEELNDFYFTKKIFKAVRSFGDKFNFEYYITMNGDVWDA